MATLHVANRDYTEWTFKNTTQVPTMSPLTAKLFHNDTVDPSGQFISSPYRTKEHICGVLLNSQKTYGRSNSGNKLLYKCVPDDPHLPCFLVPYEEKHIGFNKNRTDKYIAFKIKEWTDKHPLGVLTQTFGEVEDTEAYIAYQMANKEINESLKTLNAASLRTLREHNLDPLPLYCAGQAIEDRCSLPIISIDPVGCKDIDDAIGIRTLPNGDSILSIYIANVPMMLEYLQLWPYLTERVATIYLPDAKYPMLPVALSENMCSLREKEKRLAFVMDITISPVMYISNISYTTAIVRLEKNYAYEASELIARTDYKSMLNIVRHLNTENFAYVEEINTSHDLVEYCMLFMNHRCAKHLMQKKSGIYRAAVIKNKAQQAEAEAPAVLKHLIQNVAGEYCSYAELKPHELIGLECYLHITSPIRRVVDIVNMYDMLKDKFQWSEEAQTFMQSWQNKIEMINQKSKAIRKLQNETELLKVYKKNKEQIYVGIVFAPEERIINGTISYKYKVYIPATKLFTTARSHKKLKEYTTAHFSAHLFLDEAKMTRKIRIHIL
jgi:exoribonuclease R